jgi:hypothetical protein
MKIDVAISVTFKALLEHVGFLQKSDVSRAAPMPAT